jgi:perosamine synthetase
VQTLSIPLARPYLDAREEELVLEVLRSGHLSLGPTGPRFEQMFAERLGRRFAVACSSGTGGLHAALHRVGLGPRDEVITSSYSFISSANVILFEGATPVFVEIDEQTWNLDPAAVAAAVTPRTRAILPVHIYGYPCDMNALGAIAREHGLAIVEDACEAVGAHTSEGRPVGDHGNPAVYAFFPNKQITTGEGGMITTDDEAVDRDLRSLINQGRVEGGPWLAYDRLGFNYRMDDVSAAIGIGQLEKYEFLMGSRAQVASRYDRLLASVDGVTTPYRGPHTRGWFVYAVRLDDVIDRDAVMTRLGERGVATRPYLPAVHLQAHYRERFGFAPGMLPITERVSHSTLALPFYVGLDDDAAEYVVACLTDAIAKLR